jgi:hypothetical protein
MFYNIGPMTEVNPVVKKERKKLSSMNRVSKGNVVK